MTIEAITGKDFLSFFRALKDSAIVDADRIRFMTEMTHSMEKETDTQTTVDGVVSSIADGENTLEFTALAYRDTDPDTIAVWKQMRKWFLDSETVEVWNVDIKSGKINEVTQKTEYLVDYFRGKFTSFELSSPADGKVELSYSYTIDGNGIFDHKDTLTESQEAAVKAAQYAYQTLAKVTGV
ncbi:TPA: phage major tail protein, TP901-1 family [Streptococcus suis]|nr:phage major tail protein, TP901-1 family [Streptococcus suis]